MIKHKLLHLNLLNKLKSRIPLNSELVTKLIDILSLEKMAVYRRLRQEVPFTFEEIIILAKEFNISLDSMLGVDSRTTLPFRYQSSGGDDQSPVEINYLLLQDYVQATREVASNPQGEISLVTNMLPQPLYTGFDSIFRFYYFKWRYYSIPAEHTKSYHEIKLPEKLIQIARDTFENVKNAAESHYILDNQVFQKIVNDISYFHSIRLIRDEDIHLIKEELFQFIDYMEGVATKGFVDNPSKEVCFYISDTSIESSYCYIGSPPTLRFALIWSFIFNSIVTFDEESLEIMKHWIRSKIRTSTLLSVTGEKNRTQYFDTQRRCVVQL